MPSKARRAFDNNASDIDRLLELHERQGGSSRGRRYGLAVLNKSAIVLITSFWEAYCEDIASEGLEHIVKHAKDASVLPKELKKQIAKELCEDPNDISVWSLSDDGWRDVLKNRLERLRKDRNRRLNTPKSTNIDDLFSKALGISKISQTWKWATKMNAARARKKLDRYVELRGAIAHRGDASKSVTKADVTDYYDFIKKLAGKTGGKVNTYVMNLTGKSLWKAGQ